MKVVAHLHRSYLALSETFIYQYLKNFRTYPPVVLARRSENLENFPINNLFVLSDQGILTQATGYFALRLLGRQPHFLKILRKIQPVLLHAHFGSEGVNAIQLKRALGLPLITTFYGKDMSALPRQPKWQRAYNRLFKEGDAFLVEGSYMRSELAGLGCPASKIFISHIGVDLERIQFESRTRVPDQPTRLLICGRLIEKKGIPYALHALAKVVPKYPDTLLRIVGDGPLRSEYERLILELGLQANVRILGYLHYDDYVQELRNAHILLVPSVRAIDGDSEGGAPTVILEAQAMGLPVLGTQHADIPEVIGIKDPGFLVPERDSDTLADRLFMMMENPQNWPEWGRVGREHVEAHYDIRLVTANLERIYTGVLNGSKRKL
ncbi:MAG: glycosyltransferase [Anaerolineales bacterium]|nr:glycosyltransferase [Anaerolineales bacterium]